MARDASADRSPKTSGCPGSADPAGSGVNQARTSSDQPALCCTAYCQLRTRRDRTSDDQPLLPVEALLRPRRARIEFQRDGNGRIVCVVGAINADRIRFYQTLEWLRTWLIASLGAACAVLVGAWRRARRRSGSSDEQARSNRHAAWLTLTAALWLCVHVAAEVWEFRYARIDVWKDYPQPVLKLTLLLIVAVVALTAVAIGLAAVGLACERLECGTPHPAHADRRDVCDDCDEHAPVERDRIQLLLT